MNGPKFRAWDERYRKYIHSDVDLDIDVFWDHVLDGTIGLGGVEQYTHLNDQDNREIYAGDVYEIMGYTYPITVDYTHGLRFMWGDEQLNNAICAYGIFRGTVHENPEVKSK